MSILSRTKVFMSDTEWQGKPMLYLPAAVCKNIFDRGVVPQGER